LPYRQNQRRREDKKTLSLLHQTIKKLTEDIDGFKFNTAIAQLMILVNHLTDQPSLTKETFQKLSFLLLLLLHILQKNFGNNWEIIILFSLHLFGLAMTKVI
jgi:leucyl-tRNA synthetase